MWMPGGTELVVIVAVIAVLFGAKKIPEFARGLRQGVEELKKPSETPVKKEDETESRAGC